MPAHEHRVAVATVRAQDAIAAAILAVVLAFLFGVAILGWALALAEAVIAIIAASNTHSRRRPLAPPVVPRERQRSRPDGRRSAREQY